MSLQTVSDILYIIVVCKFLRLFLILSRQQRIRSIIPLNVSKFTRRVGKEIKNLFMLTKGILHSVNTIIYKI